MASQPLMNSSNIADFWKERLGKIIPKFFLMPSVPVLHSISQNSALNQPLVEQAVQILTHNPTLLSKPEVVGQAIRQDNHLNDIHSAVSIHSVNNPFPKELRPLLIWAQTGRELRDPSRSGVRDAPRTIPTKRSYSTLGQLPNTPFRLPASTSNPPEFRPYGSTFDTGIFAEEYQQTSVAIESAIGATHPALDLFYQMNCLKSNIARIDGKIEALSFLRRASVMQLASLRNRYESDSHLPDPPASLPSVPTPTPSPTKKAAPATETTKGKGKQRATTKPKEVVEKKEIVEEPVKEPVVEKKKETIEEPAEEEGEALSWGDEDIEMEETGAAGEEEIVEEEAEMVEEEEDSE
ncbi:hypothetical protein H1R20_g9627, partial [Candolleomyces eurysporus]